LFETFSKFSYLDFQQYENAKGSICRLSSGGQGRSLGMSKHHVVEQNYCTIFSIDFLFLVSNTFSIAQVKSIFFVVVIDDKDEDLQGLILI